MNKNLRQRDIELSLAEFKNLQGLLLEHTGILLSENKIGLFSGRLNMRLKTLNCPSFNSYYKYLVQAQDQSEIDTFVHLMTTHETFFFREPETFNYLRDVILKNKRHERSSFRFWSAACSTGEEAYSAAMVIADKLGLTDSSPWSVVATDISHEVVKTGENGIYNKERLDFMPPEYLKSYCLNGVGDFQGKFAIRKEIRARVAFSWFNLDSDAYHLGQFDCIFLRNTLIYFEPEKKASIIRKIMSSLKPGGMLIVGNAESLRGCDQGLKQHMPSVYQLA